MIDPHPEKGRSVRRMARWTPQVERLKEWLTSRGAVCKAKSATVAASPRRQPEKSALDGDVCRTADRISIERWEVKPSFRYKLSEMRRKGLALANDAVRWEMAHPVNRIAYKLRGYDLADSLGIDHAKVLARTTGMARVRWDELPKRFAIKPCWGCSGHGVFLLERRDESLRDIQTGRTYSREEFETRFESEENHAKDFWVEELLESPDGNPLLDIKVYTFNGSIALVLVLDKNAGTHKLYGPDWEELGPVYRLKSFDARMRKPQHRRELLNAAGALSRAVKYPFVRVDLYETPRGVCLGELTPLPGGAQIFDAPWDERMGELWENAEVELTCASAPDCPPAKSSSSTSAR